jgi:hypothetical protein
LETPQKSGGGGYFTDDWLIFRHIGRNEQIVQQLSRPLLQRREPLGLEPMARTYPRNGSLTAGKDEDPAWGSARNRELATAARNIF